MKIAILLLLSTAALLGQDLTVLDAQPEKGEEMLRTYLRHLAHEALDQRRQTYEELKTPSQITTYQKRLRSFFREQLGPFPARTPLNPRSVGGKSYPDYRIEKLIYESRPGFFVTAVLYLPNSAPPYPGVLVPCGHTSNGKAGYQEASILLAKSGLATLCFDPIGQGERKQLIDPEYPATTEHMILSAAPILLGRNIASDMISDGIRSIDYLASRPDIDSSRIGVTGNSGGGMMTSYLMALDDRVAVAAPSCFITTTRRKNESPGPGDAEQNIHAQIAGGLDHPDYVLLRAPRPTLILSATQDFVPIAGAWDSFRQAKRLYTRLGRPEGVSLVETDARHGFSQGLREGAAQWMRRWLLDADGPVDEQPATTEPDEVLQCTPTGQVIQLPGARSIFDFNAERERSLARQRRRIWQQVPPDELRARIRKIAGVRPLAELGSARAESRGTLERSGYRIEKIVLHPEEGIQLPALHFRPASATADPVLYVHGDGKHVDAQPSGPIEKLVRAGHPVLAVDLRGIGETAVTPWRYNSTMAFTGGNPAEFFIAYMLGKSFIGMRAEDTLSAARYLAGKSSGGVRVIATGEAGPAALHAAALEPQLITDLAMRDTLTSWSDIVHTPAPMSALVHAVHGALETYDLPDLLTLTRTTPDHSFQR